MEILNNLEWYFYNDEPKEAKNRDTGKKITKQKLNTIVFDDSVKENVKFCFPLNDDFTFTETRELQRPVTVKQVLTLVNQFYNELLTQEIIDKSFGENIQDKTDWMEEMMYDGDTSNLTKYNLLNDDCATPDFCGIHLMEDTEENRGEYFIEIGPE